MSQFRRPAQEKIFEISALLKQLEKWHNAGDEIVFTNGVFDILHLQWWQVNNHLL